MIAPMDYGKILESDDFQKTVALLESMTEEQRNLLMLVALKRGQRLLRRLGPVLAAAAAGKL